MQLLRFDAGEILLWIGDRSDDPRVIAIDPATGRDAGPRRVSASTWPACLPRRERSRVRCPTACRSFRARRSRSPTSRRSFCSSGRAAQVAFDRDRGGAFRWSAERTLDEVHSAIAHPFGLAIAGLQRDPANEVLRPAVVVIDPRTGDVLHRIFVQSRSGVIWMAADGLGSLLCATEEGLELIDLLQGQRRWTNIAFDAMEARQGWLAGDRFVVESRTSRLFTVRVEDGALSAPFDTDIRGDWEADALSQVHVDGDSLIAQYSERIVRYDLDGRVLGADIVSDERDYRWLLTADDLLVAVSLYESRQQQAAGNSRQPRTHRTYRVYFLSPNCKLEGAMLQATALTKRLRTAAVIDGGLLLSTDAETLLLRLPK